MKIQSAKAGIGTGRAGLQAASGLFSSAGLFQKGVKSFNPLDLDPYLLFDAETSMLGTLEAKTLDLDPSNPSTLDVITATRSGTTATYTDSSGLIQVASADTVRVDHTQGEQLTPTVYQRVGYTDFSSGWGAFGGFTAQSSDDFGGQPAIRLVSDGTSSNYYQVEIQNTEEQQQYVFSFYCRRVSGSGDIAARHALSVTGSSTSITVTSNWQRVSVTCLGRTGGGGSIFVGLIQSTGDGVYEFSQPQVEEGTTASDFVANTTGSPKFIASATYGPRVPMILVEPAATNLITNTDFSDWTSNDVSVTDGSGYKGQTSKIITRIAGISQSLFYHRFDAGDYTFSTEHTGSFWIRKVAGTNTQIYIDFYRASSSQNPIINLTEEWQKVEIAITSPSINWFRFGLYFSPSQTSLGDAVEIAMPQVEEGSVATSFIPTSGSAVTRAADDLQIERDSTNLVPYSEDFSQWSNISGGGGTLLTANYGISPDGTQNSTRVEFSGSSKQLSDNITTSSSSTGSVWVKGTSGETIRFGVYASEANFTLNGSWQRIQRQGTATSNILTINTYGGATARDLEIWGGQLEDGTEATSYIPTSGAPASRTTFSDLFNSGGGGTFYAEYQFNDADGANSLIYGSADNQRFAYKNFGSASPLLSWDGTNVLDYGRLAAGTLLRTALSFDSNTMEGSQDGSAATMSGQTAPFPHTGNFFSAGLTTELNIGSDTTGAKHLNGHLKRLIYWPTHSDSL